MSINKIIFCEGDSYNFKAIVEFKSLLKNVKYFISVIYDSNKFYYCNDNKISINLLDNTTNHSFESKCYILFYEKALPRTEMSGYISIPNKKSSIQNDENEYIIVNQEDKNDDTEEKEENQEDAIV